jgi:hypothetical protein
LAAGQTKTVGRKQIEQQLNTSAGFYHHACPRWLLHKNSMMILSLIGVLL